jgi:hypothetical protein
MIFDEHDEACYIGKATRSLRDRIVNKHLSGDESHAIQREYQVEYPDRAERRKFIRANLRVKWRLIGDLAKLASLERLLIWLLQPRCNRA